MTEIRKVSYRLTGANAPVIHLDCRSLPAEQKVETIKKARDSSPEDWKEYVLLELKAWLQSSKDRNKTLKTWGEAFIRCGSCKHAWSTWLSSNPPSDPVSEWTDRAIEQITKNGWV